MLKREFHVAASGFSQSGIFDRVRRSPTTTARNISKELSKRLAANVRSAQPQVAAATATVITKPDSKSRSQFRADREDYRRTCRSLQRFSFPPARAQFGHAPAPKSGQCGHCCAVNDIPDSARWLRDHAESSRVARWLIPPATYALPNPRRQTPLLIHHGVASPDRRTPFALRWFAPVVASALPAK